MLYAYGTVYSFQHYLAQRAAVTFITDRSHISIPKYRNCVEAQTLGVIEATT
jgi:hypothetical protein